MEETWKGSHSLRNLEVLTAGDARCMLWYCISPRRRRCRQCDKGMLLERRPAFRRRRVDRQCASPGQTNLHRHGDNGDDRHGLIGIKPIKGPRLRLCSRLKSSSCPGTPATTRVSLFESLSALFSVSTCVCCQRRRPSQHHGLPQERLPGAARRRGRQSMACFCGWHVCCIRRCSLWVRSIIRCHLSVSSSPAELTVRLG